MNESKSATRDPISGMTALIAADVSSRNLQLEDAP